jgi:uncharacterized membrane protein (UPF0127 family)
MRLRTFAAAVALAALPLTACSGGDATASATQDSVKTIPLTIKSANGAHDFVVETAKTEQEQQRGLMYRTNIPANAGMLFAPYPPSGPPRAASFWMKNTPSPLDIIFIRADGTIATIAENTTPFSEAPIPSGEPVAAVLEINGGRSAELGISQGDTVTWPGHGKS